MAKDRVCVVTGANKGVGYAIVKELSKKFDGLIYLTGNTYNYNNFGILTF
jgi:carbonyl reductase 1